MSQSCVAVAVYVLFMDQCCRMAEKVQLPDAVTEHEPQVTEAAADKVPGVAGAGAGAGSSDQQPCCVIVLGMAGSGKTTFVQR